jgi:hypothetical protein
MACDSQTGNESKYPALSSVKTKQNETVAAAPKAVEKLEMRKSRMYWESGLAGESSYREHQSKQRCTCSQQSIDLQQLKSCTF